MFSPQVVSDQVFGNNCVKKKKKQQTDRKLVMRREVLGADGRTLTMY